MIVVVIQDIPIGTITPSSLLHISVDSATESSPSMLISTSSTTGNDSVLQIRGSTDTSTTNDQAQLVFANYDNDLTTTNIMGKITGKVTNATTNVGDMVFYSYSDGSTSSEAMRITSTGDVEFSSDVDVTGIATAESWTITSDIRLKRDIEIADYNLCYENIKQLELKNYKWKDDYVKINNVKLNDKIGWIADDVEKILPNAIHINKGEKYKSMGINNDLKTIDTDALYANMYGALKKLIEKHENLINKIQNSSSLDELKKSL